MVAQEQQSCHVIWWMWFYNAIWPTQAILALACCQNPEFLQPLSWRWRYLYFRWWISVKVGTHQSRCGPSFRPRALIQICTLGGGRWGHQSIRAAFHRCSQQHGGEVMARSSWPGSSTLMVWWGDGSQPIAYGEILSIVLTRNMRRKIVLRAPAWRKLIGLV